MAQGPAITSSPGPFCIVGAGTGASWVWQFEQLGVFTSSVVTVPAPITPAPATVLRDAFRASIAAQGITGLTATDGPGSDCFTLTYAPGGIPANFRLWVGPTPNVACLISGNPVGCSFNPMIYEQQFLSAAVPALQPWAMLGMAAILLGVAARHGVRSRIL